MELCNKRDCKHFRYCGKAFNDYAEDVLGDTKIEFVDFGCYEKAKFNWVMFLIILSSLFIFASGIRFIFELLAKLFN